MDVENILRDLLSVEVLSLWLLGMIFGIFVGSTPGLTATMAVALIVPIGFQLSEPTAGLAMIIGVSFTAIFAGDIPATHLRIPGTPASAAATLDGHELAKQGKGNLALTINLLCSCIGGIIGVLLLLTIAPGLAFLARDFDSFEYFWLAVLGLSLSAVVSRGNINKGLLAALLGLLLSTVGTSVFSGLGRFTFGTEVMKNGFHFIPVMIGLFGISEVLRSVLHPTKLVKTGKRGGGKLPVGEALRHIWQRKRTVVQSAGAGTVIGALPGAGADIAAWGAYGLAQKTSKEGEKFGTGSLDGVVAPTSANNAAVAGAWIPALVFGLPGDAVTAIVVGAFLVYDIKPGYDVFHQSRTIALLIIALVTQFLLLPAGLIGIKAFGLILRLPRGIIMTGVVIFSVVGSYAINQNMFDVYVMFAFGLVGFYFDSRRVPLAPLILGLILGKEFAEENLRQGLISSGGDLTPFFTHTFCPVLIGLLLLAFTATPLLRTLRRFTRKRRQDDNANTQSP